MNERSLRTFCSQLGIPLEAFQSTRGWITAPCPFAPYTHQSGHDHRPSFAVAINETGYSSFNCQTCKLKGTLASLAFRLAGFREDRSLRQLANEIQVQEIRGYTPPDWEDAPQVGRPLRQQEVRANHDLYPSFVEHRVARAYLKARNITVGTALALGLRYDAERGRVLFPVYDGRRVFRGFTGRAVELPTVPASTTAQWLNREGGTRPKVRDYLGLPKRALLLGEHRVQTRPGARVVLVEGLFAYALFRQYGVPNVVALLGSAPTPEKADTLLRWDLPVVCFLDNDQAGQDGIFGKITEDGKTIPGMVDFLYGRLPLLIPKWPDGITDPDDLTKAQTFAAIKHADLFAG